MALVLSGSIDISGSMTATTILVSSPGAAGMVSSSAQITELAPLMAYTASIKGAAIVSSSQQVQNYFTFAKTGSANTFYGTQTISGDVTASVLNLTKSPDGIFAELGGNTPKLNLYKFSSGNVMNIGHNYYYDGVAYGKNDISKQGWEFRSHITNGQYTISHSPDAVTTLNQLIKVDATTGDLTITNGNLVLANGKGIDFSATANSGSTTTSEILNDYEEGTWTATATYSGTNTPTHAYQTGHYTKIGRVVQIQALISWNENGSTGNLTITGLPFTANSTVGRAVTSMMNFGFSGLTTNLVGEVENSTTFIKIRKADNAGTIVTATDTDNDQDLYISCTYMV